jgi:hypothetical protein
MANINASTWHSELQFLEVIRLEGHGFSHDEVLLSRDMYLLQVLWTIRVNYLFLCCWAGQVGFGGRHAAVLGHRMGLTFCSGFLVDQVLLRMNYFLFLFIIKAEM